jgi:hypothetical protein
MARYLASTGTFNASHKLKIYSIVKKYIWKCIRKVRSKKTYTFTGKNILNVFNFTEGKTILIFNNIPAHFVFLK